MDTEVLPRVYQSKMKNGHRREFFSAPGITQNMNEASLSDAILYTRREGLQATRSSKFMAIRPNGGKWFVRLYAHILTEIRSVSVSIMWMESKLI